MGKATDHERGHPGAEVHAKLEESVIYPAIRNEIDDEKVMDEALEEHHVAHVLLNELKRMKGNDRYEAIQGAHPRREISEERLEERRGIC